MCGNGASRRLEFQRIKYPLVYRRASVYQHFLSFGCVQVAFAQEAEGMSDTAVNGQHERQRPRGKPWPRGVSGNALGSRVHDAKCLQVKLELLKELGGGTIVSLSDQELLARAVELLVRRARSNNDSVRAINTAHRILAALRAKYAAREPERRPLPSLSELLKATQIERGSG
jgi:hypothetical protein